MHIPVDEASPELPADVAALAGRRDLVPTREARPGQSIFRSGRLPASSLYENYILSPFLGSGDSLGTGEEPVPIPLLERWTVQAHAYTVDAAAKIGLFGRLFGGDAKLARAGVVHEAKRFTVRRTDEGTNTEFGVAVRIYAATRDWDTKLQLTLPNLAADAQLNTRDSRIAIDVLGYSGLLGSVLPSPERLDVESLAAYLTAFRMIQATVFGEAGLAFLTPTLLSYDTSP